MREKILLSGKARLQLPNALLENPCKFSTEYSMPSTGETSKVFNSVVIPDSIDMVNDMSPRNFGVDLFPNISVLIDMLSFDVENSITTPSFSPTTSFVEATLIPSKGSLESSITFLTKFRPFTLQVTTLTGVFVAFIKHLLFPYPTTLRATSIIAPTKEFKRFLADNTVFNHTESIPHLRSIVKEVIHA